MRRFGTRILNYGQPVNWDAPLNRNLISWWLTLPQRNGGLRWLDLCERNNGTLVGDAAWGSGFGRSGGYGSLKFDGSGDRIDCGTNSVLQLNRSFTLVCSARFTSFPGSQSGLISKGSGSYYLRVLTSGTKLNFLQSQVSNIVTGGTALSTATWYRLGATVDASGNCTLYVNGVSDGSASTAVTFSSSTAVWLGDNFDGANPNAPLDGRLDDVKVFGRCLSASEMYLDCVESKQGNPNTLNYINPFATFASAGGGGATAFPWIIGGGVGSGTLIS